jgi:hypothetical protein
VDSFVRDPWTTRQWRKTTLPARPASATGAASDSSYGLQLSLIGFAWYPLHTLPFFVAFYVTRTLHEAIDEVKWHLDRCTERETLFHLGMWISIQGGIATLFIWGFFYRYEGVWTLPRPVLAAYALLAACLAWIGNREARGFRVRSHA